MRNLLHTDMLVVQNHHMFLCEINWSLFIFLFFKNNSSNVCQQLFRSTYNSVTISSILLAPSLSSSPTLFSKFWLSFLDCGNKHVSSSSSWHSVEATLDTADGDHKQILGTYKCIRKILLKNVKLNKTISAY